MALICSQFDGTDHAARSFISSQPLKSTTRSAIGVQVAGARGAAQGRATPQAPAAGAGLPAVAPARIQTAARQQDQTPLRS